MLSAIRAISLLVLIGMTVQINYVAVYCALFEMNRKAIAGTVCERKIRDCSGRCFLIKKVAAAEEAQPASAEKRSSNKTLNGLLDPMQALEPAGFQPGFFQAAGDGIAIFVAGVPTDGHSLRVYQPPDLMSHKAARAS